MAGGVPGGVGTKHPAKIVANIFISFIGAGILGLPFAFKEAGIVEGSLTMISVAAISVKAMLLIIDCKYKLIYKEQKVNGEAKDNLLMSKTDSPNTEHKPQAGPNMENLSYGDLGQFALGGLGKALVDIAIVVSQIGFCAGYLIFISENLASYSNTLKKWHIVLLLLPGLWLLTLLRHLGSLAITSLVGQISNLLAFTVVFWFDFEHFHLVKAIHPRTFSLDGFPFFFCVAVYCYEGAGMILSMEVSLDKTRRPQFKKFFIWTIIPVTALYVVFGLCGYLSFGPDTNTIITLNLPKSAGDVDPAMIVKSCLCLSLFFTYPIMMFPVMQILETKLISSPDTNYAAGNILRLVMVLMTGAVVMLVPNFGNLVALIGATCCTMLAFILPGLFHLKVFGKSLTRAQRWFDYFLICLGIFATCIGLWDAMVRLSKVHKESFNSSEDISAVRPITTLDPDLAELFNMTSN